MIQFSFIATFVKVSNRLTIFPVCFAFSESLFQDDPPIEGNTHFQNRLRNNTVLFYWRSKLHNSQNTPFHILLSRRCFFFYLAYSTTLATWILLDERQTQENRA